MDFSIDIFIQMAYATGIGILIGLERSMKHQKSEEVPIEEETNSKEIHESSMERNEETDTILGVRTFAIFSLIGFASSVMGEAYPIIVPLSLVSVSALVIAMYIRASELGKGITTEAAAIGVCVLGMLCHHNMQLAGVVGLIFTILLHTKHWTYQLLSKMRTVELTDTLKFLVIILILLPLMPNQALDPYGVFNPYKITFLVILISGISYVGYFLTRILGTERGLGITGLIGGLTSSTAVTAAMALQAKENPQLRWICAFSTVAANATMFARVLVVVAILEQALALQLAWSIGAMALVALIGSIVLWFVSKKQTQAEQGSQKLPIKNPFSLGPALKFAGFFVFILVVAKVAKIYLGDQGLYLASAVSGLADVDAITLTIAEQAKEQTLALNIGAIGITIAVVSNSIVKSGIAVYSGGWNFGWIVASVLLLSTGAGLAVAFFM